MNLEFLSILNAPVTNVLGLSSLTRLRSLRLGNLRRLNSLSGIEHLSNLEELELHTCKNINSLDEVGGLRSLKRLYINNDGNIMSLSPLDGLERLESVLFYESTNILDGDLSPLLRQTNLSRVAFRDRRHYSHRREQIVAAYARRSDEKFA